MTRTTTTTRALAASGAALALALTAGCGSDDGASADGGSDGITVRTTEFSWVAATLTNEVVRQVAADHPDLGVADLETSQLDPAAAWAGAGNGDLDLVTEVALPNQQPLLDQTEGFELLGEVYSGADQGWYVPSYALEPGQPLEGLTSVTQLPEYADALGSTLYDADPGWITTEQNEARLAGYDIGFEHSTSSAAALFAQLDRAYEREEPVLVYLYQPHWVFAQYDVTKLEEPNPYEEGCFAEGGAGDCAMPDYAGGVAASDELQEEVPAFTEMLSRMEIPVDDMDAMIAEVDVEERDAADVAQEWVEENDDAVESWVG
ncbi:glycine betaine ABC transporter substrate-binding protein [uncultured Pseudokineococcus sp.]|uniref:glycine betaine ABC transporter substrate-binding protein n=1 Tax=uncultured Pseudokineococcus sp. TaxID=1642928 RepID=UPI002625C47D|nr:glycine betaine ABC transporter substrate-binding protein [uncultured Pseudokineococcus sp.]